MVQVVVVVVRVVCLFVVESIGLHVRLEVHIQVVIVVVVEVVLVVVFEVLVVVVDEYVVVGVFVVSLLSYSILLFTRSSSKSASSDLNDLRVAQESVAQSAGVVHFLLVFCNPV